MRNTEVCWPQLQVLEPHRSAKVGSLKEEQQQQMMHPSISYLDLQVNLRLSLLAEANNPFSSWATFPGLERYSDSWLDEALSSSLSKDSIVSSKNRRQAFSSADK